MSLPPPAQNSDRQRSLVFWGLGFLLISLLCFLGLRHYILPALDSTRLPPGQWKTFTRQFVSPDGRVIDTGNDNVSHTEGQGYGLLFAVAYDDREAFDKIWKWTRVNLQVREDSLFAWKWTPIPGKPGGTVELNNASDGDLLIAWALYRAFLQWKDPEYALAATQILDSLRQAAIVPADPGLVLLPGEQGFVHDSRLTLNPSYFIFPALQDLSRLIFRKEMKGLFASGEKICTEARFGAFDLPPDWVWLQGPTFSLPENSDLPSDFGYNAIRIPLQIAWATPNSELLAPFVNYWRSTSENSTPLSSTLALPSDTPGPDPALPGMLAIRDFVIACHDNEPFLPRQIPPIAPDEAYYSAALKLLTSLAARDVLLQARLQLTPGG